jgi:predicted dehydrogenase
MKIAIVGSGSVGRRHISNLLALGAQDLVVVSEHHKHARFESDGHTLPVVHSYREALDTADAVVIANPSSLHARYLALAVEAGKHVYLEKPAALESADLESSIGHAKTRSLVIATGTQFRFCERLIELKQHIDAGTVGRVLSVTATCGEHIADYHPEEDYKISYAARKELGGGVLLTQIHQLDYLNWIFGDFQSVVASGGELAELGIDVEGAATYFLISRTGVPVAGHLNYVQRPKHTSLTVIGSRGQLYWDYGRNRLEVQREGGEREVTETPFDRNQMFLDCMSDFLACAESGRSPRADLAAGRDSLRLVEAIKQSFGKNEMVRI